MRLISLLLVLLLSFSLRGQVLVNVQLPPTGVMQKSQLWNISLTNTGSVPLSIHIELMMIDRTSAQQVMSATTPILVLPGGFTQLSNSIIQPVQYNVLSSSYLVDANPAGLLPIGDFEICYNIMNHYSDAVERIAEQCQDVLIEPLSPPQLLLPQDLSVLEQLSPQFSWLAPMPAHLFTQLRYDLDLVEVLPHQTATDAMQQNIPLFQQKNISVATLQYPISGSPILVKGKVYAWRIIAKNNEAMVAQSEVWSFSFKGASDKLKNTGRFPYAKLQKSELGGYAVFADELKFDYLNEAGDRIWRLKILDLSTSLREQIPFNIDTVSIKPGQNLVNINLSKNKAFLSNNFYMLEIANSRNEVWRLRFQFIRTDEE
ncbi:hypothetical protein [Flavihumibacter sp. CACIAM 22H1]|uniref:hypothetical protein n=1 Tax=Flavihumibacter sp. CACIAM 22H1 TaxID=1812911 RepID=UPI0007A8BE3D|nr:hypothetical protein [Flavihumibacter sp. CACIAM 22H1]KYP14098.1 MAG: hypothetical protein A1D16_00060 [Flavihumibacter sp. CACIAM 22H1]